MEEDFRSFEANLLGDKEKACCYIIKRAGVGTGESAREFNGFAADEAVLVYLAAEL